MLLNIRRQFVRVVRTFRAGEDRAADALRMTPYRCEREMSAVTDGPETYLGNSERLAEIFEIVGALVCVVRGEIDALHVTPVLNAGFRILAQFFNGQFASGSDVERQGEAFVATEIWF